MTTLPQTSPLPPARESEERHPRPAISQVNEASPEPKTRIDAFLALIQRAFLLADRLIESVVPSALNPLAHTGAIATGSFLVAALTGVLILPWYSVSAHGAWSSIEAMANSPLTAGLIRSLHRYSSDLSIFFAAIHALRLLSARRFGGARALAWITGIGLVLILWFVGWLGYWLVWDQRAQRVATGTAKMLDGLPIFADPLSRSFISNEALNSLLFFMVFFFHMLVPLAMAILLWIHISHLSRSRFLPSKAMAWLIGLTLIGLSLLYPASSAPRADLLRPVANLSIDYFYLLPLSLSERLSGGSLWLILFVVLLVAGSIPFLLPKGRAKPAVVDPARCNGCTHCYEDCPYDAIRMVPRADDRPYDLVAEVDPSRCVGCGICAGSCDSAGIFLPQLPVLDERKRIEGWVEEGKKQGEEVNLAFVCAFSAGGRMKIDPESGKSEALPGYRVVAVPCTGWIQRFTLERAMRRGANSALIVGCGHSEPHFREGSDWTQLRLEGAREPGLRHDKVDMSRIHHINLDQGRWLDLMRVAARLRKGEPIAEVEDKSQISLPVLSSKPQANAPFNLLDLANSGSEDSDRSQPSAESQGTRGGSAGSQGVGEAQGADKSRPVRESLAVRESQAVRKSQGAGGGAGNFATKPAGHPSSKDSEGSAAPPAQKGKAKATPAPDSKNFPPATPPSKRPVAANPRLIGGAAALGVVIALMVGFGSDLPYATPKPQSELVVSFKHPGQMGEECRQLTAEEKARQPVHMKQEEICERARASVRLRVRVDGEVIHEQAYEPRGLRSDGNSVAVQRIPLAPGRRHIEVAIGDDHHGGWQFENSRELELDEGSSTALIFDRVSGFSWHHALD